jgi:poly-beta-1,6-N-acetyl-D-glucosamine synthase
MCTSVLSYVIVTPAHNEESYIRYTLDSVVAQSFLPAQWVIIDDGSTDDTWNIIQSYAEKYPWIQPIKKVPDSNKREGGAKVVKAFWFGYDSLNEADYAFLVKLDADLTLPPNYFEEVGRTFELDSTVGMCGGYCAFFSNGAWKKEQSASYHLRGPIKAYRQQCFEDIGGLKPLQNWDFLDEMKAMSLGWEVKILPLEVHHHRRTSTLINRGLGFSFKKGGVYYKDGYDFLLLLLRSVPFGLITKPYILSSFSLLAGFIMSSIKRPEKDVDADLERFIRRYQYGRIKNAFKNIFPR